MDISSLVQSLTKMATAFQILWQSNLKFYVNYFITLIYDYDYDLLTIY